MLANAGFRRYYFAPREDVSLRQHRALLHHFLRGFRCRLDSHSPRTLFLHFKRLLQRRYRGELAPLVHAGTKVEPSCPGSYMCTFYCVIKSFLLVCDHTRFHSSLWRATSRRLYRSHIMPKSASLWRWLCFSACWSCGSRYALISSYILLSRGYSRMSSRYHFGIQIFHFDPTDVTDSFWMSGYDSKSSF